MSEPPPPPRDVIDKWQRDVIGNAMRVHAPLRSKADLLRVAAILREFSNRLEVLAKRRDNDEFGALLQAKSEAKAVQGRLVDWPKGP